LKALKLRTLVVDIDDTLLIGGRLSRFFWWISLQMQRIGRRLQRVNPEVVSKLVDYDVVVVLTGRDAKESRFTEDQLRGAGISFDRLICCPRKKLISEWKWSAVRELGKDNPIVWIDDMLVGSPVGCLATETSPNLTLLTPEVISERATIGSELEWL